MFKQTLSFVACATLVASIEADILSLEPIVITSNAIETDEIQAPYATEIYTSKEIEASHAMNIYEFFTRQNSLIVSPNYNNPFSQKIDMHGYGSGETGYENIVVTLDGRRLNNIDLSPHVLGSIPLSSIERIEILKGAGSVIYGDGANAGVINIITKKGDEKQLTLSAGNFHTFNESLYLSNTSQKLSYAIQLDHYDSNGKRTIDSDGGKDIQKSTSGGVTLSYHPTNETEIFGSADFTRNDSFYGGTMTEMEYHDNPSQQGHVDYGYGPQSSIKTGQKTNIQTATIGLNQSLNETLSLNLRGSQEIKQTNFAYYYTSTPTLTTLNYRKYQFDGSLNYDTEPLSTVLGFQGIRGERVSEESDFAAKNQTNKENKAIYLSGEYRFDGHTLNVGGRYESASYHFKDPSSDASQKDSLYSYELGYSYLIDTKQSIFLHYSHGFQFPDIDRFFKTDFTSFPYVTSFNGLIDPMKTDTYSIGYNRIDRVSKFKASLYYVDLQNEIYYYENPLSGYYANTNLDHSHKYGVDLNYLRSLNEIWKMALGYNYVNAIIDNEKIDGNDFSGNHLPGVSNHSAQATLTYMPNPQTTLSLSQLYRSKSYAQLDFGNNFSQKQEAYYSTNMTFNYAKDNYELFAKINNLFDRSNGVWIRDDQVYPADFERTISAGIKFIF